MNAQVAIAEAVNFYESAPTWFLASDLRQARNNGTPNVARIIEYVLGERGITESELENHPLPEVSARLVSAV